MDRFIAMEGIISKFSNRKVQLSKRIIRDKDQMATYRNVDELYQAACDAEKNTYDRREVDGIVEGLPYILQIDDDAMSDHGKSISILKKIQRSVGKAQNLLGEYIAKEYNDSNGKSGAWAWSNTDEPFSPKKASDAIAKIRLEAIDIRLKASGISVILWYDDGDLWYGHSILVHDLFDKNGNMNESAMRVTIEG